MFRILFSLLVCQQLTVVAQQEPYKEKYRPQFHFSPKINWTNDPNGLLYYKGQYHLFYQHNPFGNVWGHMTWAHAVSKDLIHWKHLPIAIPEENNVMIFSGTCVADINNTRGFGKGGKVPLVAVYTGHIEGVNQSQHIAYSLDDGITWTKYNNNPILDLQKKDFRDPKIFWYAPKKYWVMCLMLPVEHVVQFYSSTNLINWKHLSDFGPVGDTSGVWECPDLTQVPVESNKGKKKWLLQMSMNASMQYYVGEFDGIRFINENPADKIMRPDYGPDYYAAICYGQLPAAHLPTAIGWVNNWNYANDIPTTPWKGAMSIPRTLSVKKVNNEWLLIQKPVEKIKELGRLVYMDKNIILEKPLLLPVKTQQCMIELKASPSANAVMGIKLAAGNNHELIISYNAANKMLSLDRSKTANQSFNKKYESINRFEAPLDLINNQLQLTIFFDNSIVEVFANNGERVLTAQLFPDNTDSQIELFSNNSSATIHSCFVYNMKTVW
jgi:fructan beta-fructosidase